jgi:hypothetical protein
VVIGAENFAFGVKDADLENRDAFDLQGTILHEVGHSFGLSHSLDAQRSALDGRGAVMRGAAPFDPIDKLSLRTLDTDDIAWASYLYPQGSVDRAPAARKPGGVPFANRYGLIKGSITHGRRGLPVPGGAVFAVDRETRELMASGHSGAVQFSGDPDTGELSILPPESGIVHGRFVIPVPAGSTHCTRDPRICRCRPASSTSRRRSGSSTVFSIFTRKE